MNDRATLLAACLEQPADDTTRLVYADWLRDQDNPATAALGRFIWAGVTLAGFRGCVLVEDGMFFDATRELSDTAPQVLASQLKAVLGWEWDETLWDVGGTVAKSDEVVASRMHNEPPGPGGYRLHPGQVRRGAASRKLACVTYERGMLTAVRLTLGDWREHAAAILAACPLERVEVLDVPGLTFTVELTLAGWRLQGVLKIPRQPDPMGLTVLPAASYEVTLPNKDGYPTRNDIVKEFGLTLECVATCLRLDAGDRWPGPEISEAFPATNAGLYTQADIDESDEQHRLNNPHYHQPEQWRPEDLYEHEVSGPIDSEDM